MERKKVRIYKAPNGQGEYINKTGQFLKKAQMGAETRSDEVMQQKQLEPVMQFVSGALDNEMQPEEIMKILISKGLPKELVYSIISNVMQQREAQEEESVEEEQPAEESKIGQSEYQPIGEEEVPEEEVVEEDPAMDYYNSSLNEPDSNIIEEEYQDGGPILYGDLSENSEEEEQQISPELIEQLRSLKDFTDNSNDLEGFDKDISEYESDYTPIEWDNINDGYGNYKRGGSKKNFAKNVLSLLKKAEGGDTQEIGQGNKRDTITDDISKIKNQFTSKLKEVSNKAAIDAIYEKMMKSNNPELMQSAQELAQNRQKNSQMGTFEPTAQQGGYIGENQPDMFNYGGSDMPQAQKGLINNVGDFLLGERYTTANNPYNVKSGALYRDPLTGLTPVARTVHKRGLLGRPKKYTDYYSKSGNIGNVGKINENYINEPKKETKKESKLDSKLEKTAYDKDLESDNLSRSEKRMIKKDKKWLDKMEPKWAKLDAEDAAFRNFDKDLPISNYLNDKLKKEFFANKDKSEKPLAYWNEKDLQDNILWNNVNNKEEELPTDWEFGKSPYVSSNKFSESYTNGVNNMQEEGFNRLEDIEDKNYDPRLLINDKFPETQTRDLLLSKDPRFQPGQGKIGKKQVEKELINTELNNNPFLNPKSKEDYINNWYNPTLDNAEKYSSDIAPLLTDPSYYNFNEKQPAQEEELYLRDGGYLPKAQIGVKSPTNGVSKISDPTATSTDISGMLKPKNNLNTFIGVSDPFMNQNRPVDKDAENFNSITTDPNQTKDNKITSLDFGDPSNDDLIAQDVENRRKFNGVNFDTKLNMGLDAFTGGMRGLDQAKQQNEMYANNFNADSLYGASTNKDKGDYVAYGQQTGMFRPNETGQETMGRFAYGQSGGYMQEGGYAEGDVVDMTEEELAEFLANGGQVEYLNY